jgi:hypothetical protein
MALKIQYIHAFEMYTLYATCRLSIALTYRLRKRGATAEDNVYMMKQCPHIMQVAGGSLPCF